MRAAEPGLTWADRIDENRARGYSPPTAYFNAGRRGGVPGCAENSRARSEPCPRLARLTPRPGSAAGVGQFPVDARELVDGVVLPGSSAERSAAAEASRAASDGRPGRGSPRAPAPPRRPAAPAAPRRSPARAAASRPRASPRRPCRGCRRRGSRPADPPAGPPGRPAAALPHARHHRHVAGGQQPGDVGAAAEQPDGQVLGLDPGAQVVLQGPSPTIATSGGGVRPAHTAAASSSVGRPFARRAARP